MRARLALACAALLGCVHGASHHIRRIESRDGARAERCADPPLYNDRGPDRPRESLAVVTAECDRDREAQCRAELRRGTCEADADALVEVSDQVIRGGVRRMVGVAVQWRGEAR